MKAGDRVLTYIVERELGEGGMGTVYLARHTALDQLVAIKSLSLMLSRDEALRARFLQEANIQAKLRHPGIVQVLTADMESEQPSLVMEYIDGKSLSEVLELRGALPIDDALKIIEQVLSAVGYAHRQGVIHRDLKPSNVMVMATGEAKVTDFGIAKVLGSSKLTRTGTAMGSAQYMSPEQIQRPETVDARSDIYALGCVFYEVLTGRPPFGEKDASGTESDYEVKTAHVTEAAPALETVKSSIPEWLAKLVMSMLEKEPDQRPSSCEAILAALAGGRNVEKTQIISGNDKPDWGQPKSGQEEIQKEPLKTLGTSSAEIKTAKSSNAAVVIVVVLIASVAAISFFLFEKTRPNQQATTKVKPPTPPYEQIAETITRRAEQLTLKIESGNPNNLKACPTKQTARHHNCWGTVTTSDGAKYIGEIQDNKRNGLGTYTWPDGEKYVGEFKDDTRNGLGMYTWPDGEKYVGEFREDQPNGQGTGTSPEGEKYVGEYKANKRNGLGTCTWPDNKKYVGEWANDQLNGRGIRYRADGNIEESGIFQEDKLITSKYLDPNSLSRIVKDKHPIDTKKDDGHGASQKDGGHVKLGAETPARELVAPDADNQRWKFNYYALEKPLLSNLAGSRKVMQVTLTVMTHYDDRVIMNVKTHELALRAGILDVMRKKTESDLRKTDFRKVLAEEVRLTINSVLEKYEGFGGIEEVMFTEFVVN
jgi:serine/threonine protein kinase